MEGMPSPPAAQVPKFQDAFPDRPKRIHIDWMHPSHSRLSISKSLKEAVGCSWQKHSAEAAASALQFLDSPGNVVQGFQALGDDCQPILPHVYHRGQNGQIVIL
jgi:hypothetical protein